MNFPSFGLSEGGKKLWQLFFQNKSLSKAVLNINTYLVKIYNWLRFSNHGFAGYRIYDSAKNIFNIYKGFYQTFSLRFIQCKMLHSLNTI